MKSMERKLAIIRKAAVDLQNKAREHGLPEPHSTWVTDLRAGTLMLTAPPGGDTSVLRPIDWESKRFVVTLFCMSRQVPIWSYLSF